MEHLFAQTVLKDNFKMNLDRQVAKTALEESIKMTQAQITAFNAAVGNIPFKLPPVAPCALWGFIKIPSKKRAVMSVLLAIIKAAHLKWFVKHALLASMAQVLEK